MRAEDAVIGCLRVASDAVDELILGIKATPRSSHPSCLCSRNDDTSPIGTALLPFSIFLAGGPLPYDSDKVAGELDAYTERWEAFCLEVSRDLGDSHCGCASELQSTINKACSCLHGILINKKPADSSALNALNQTLDTTYTTWAKAIEENPSSTPVTKEDLEKATDKVTGVVINEAGKLNKALRSIKAALSSLADRYNRLVDAIKKWFPFGKPKGTRSNFENAIDERYAGTETIRENMRRLQVRYVIDYSYQHPLTYHPSGDDRAKLFRSSNETTLYTAAQACINEHPEWANNGGYTSTQALLLGCQGFEERKKNPIRFKYAP